MVLLTCPGFGFLASQIPYKEVLSLVLSFLLFHGFLYHLHEWAVFFPKFATVDQVGQPCKLIQ
jgi:hypothetical protein